MVWPVARGAGKMAVRKNLAPVPQRRIVPVWVQPAAGRGREPEANMKRHTSDWPDFLWMNIALPLLRLVHAWSGRHYRRTLLRRELRRISRNAGGAQRAGGGRPAGSN